MKAAVIERAIPESLRELPAGQSKAAQGCDHFSRLQACHNRKRTLQI